MYHSSADFHPSQKNKSEKKMLESQFNHLHPSSQQFATNNMPRQQHQFRQISPPNNGFHHPNKHMMHHPQNQVFVKVSFDFEYLGEDGKKVNMREGEVLLLINKTNRDWWQVRMCTFIP